MSETRTKKASRNMIVGVSGKLIIMLFAFATKTIFIRILGVDYNGVNGLYSNILALLALSELGVGNVLNYSLYSALKENNKEKIKSLVLFFKKIYFCIAIAISVIGLALVPFLKYIINSDLPHNELVTYYILYLINSVVSYIVIYKTTVIIADQNSYVSSICEITTTILMCIAQIIYILLFKDFLGFLVIQVLCTVLKNILLNCIANKKYPYLKKIGSVKNTLSNEEKSIVLDNIKSTFFYKISAVIINNTDNILISIIVGTVFVGYYSNYNMITGCIVTYTAIFINSISAGLGNLNSEKDIEASYRMFKILCLIFSFIGTIAFCCLLNCFQPFIQIWIGQNNVMDFSWVIVITFNLYINTLMNPIWMFRETMGLFKQVRYIMLITAALNIVFSIILGYCFGVPGIIAATFIARLATQYWYEPRILFEKFHKPVRLFYYNQIKQVILMLISAVTSMTICSFIGNNILCLFLRAFLSAIISVFIVWLANYRSEAMSDMIIRYIKPITQKILLKYKRKNNL